MTPEDADESDRTISTGALLGAVGGFALAYRGLETRSAGRGGSQPPAISLHLAPDLTPERRGVTLAGSF